MDTAGTVLITGGAGGIGLAAAREFAAGGYRVLLSDRDPARLAAAAEALGGGVETFAVDVTDRAAVEACATEILRRHGGLDVLVNNAGVGFHGEIAETGLDTWRMLLDVNFWGPLYHIYAFLPSMRERGRGHIVNVSSGQAFIKMPTWGAYAAIKAALGVASEVLHWELRKHGIRVTTVYPGMVNTGFYKGVETHTLGGKLSMLLLPLYSMSPARMGRILVRAVAREEKVELSNLHNRFAWFTQGLPLVPDLTAVLSERVLAKH
ncbi:MAG: SDR family oxidoreductase [Deltaproteobacteria bacterium]|nr:SDR family oxidoreductase [Deltaproteobacteria bacterium]